MSDTTENDTAKKPAKKKAKAPAAKKPANTKKPAKKTEKPAVEAATPAKKRGRPAGTKNSTEGKKRGRPAGKRRGRKGKKGDKQIAYLLLTKAADGKMTAGALNGPFASEKDALDDASLMSDEKAETTVVLFRETKRGTVQRQTKFVVGR